MTVKQQMTVRRNCALNDGRAKNPFDLGWAERAEVEQKATTPSLPKDPMFRCELLAGENGRFSGKIETAGATRQNWGYTYDKDGRLTEAKLNELTVEQYTYDHEGRRATSKCQASKRTSTDYAYDSQDRLLAMGATQFAYDLAGRMVGKTERGQTTTYTYDDSGFLAHVDFPGGQHLAYERDSSGLIRRKLLNGQPQEEFVWRDGVRLENWRDVLERRTLEFHYEEDDRAPHAITVYEDGYPYHCALGVDQAGTVKTVADDTGYLIKELQYDSFGNLLEDSNPRFYLPLGFAGGIQDRQTGLVRFGWRYYMPEAGRFIAPDPARWQGGDPDLYDYCIDDPIGRVDPLGLEPKSASTEQLLDRPPTVVTINGKEYDLADAKEEAQKKGKKYFWMVFPKPKACEKCQELAGQIFYYKPDCPHPNCKCEIIKIEVTENKKQRKPWIINGTLDGWHDHLNHRFTAVGPVKLTAKGVVAPPFAGVFFTTSHGGDVVIATPLSIESSKIIGPDDDLARIWTIDSLLVGADNCQINYTIEYIIEE